MPFRAGGAGARPPCRWLCRHPPRYGRDTHALPCVPLSPEGFRHPGAWALGLGRPLQRPLWSPSQVSSLQEKGLDPCPTCHPACRSLEAQCVLPPPGQVGFLSFRTSDHPLPQLCSAPRTCELTQRAPWWGGGLVSSGPSGSPGSHSQVAGLVPSSPELPERGTQGCGPESELPFLPDTLCKATCVGGPTWALQQPGGWGVTPS